MAPSGGGFELRIAHSSILSCLFAPVLAILAPCARGQEVLDLEDPKSAEPGLEALVREWREASRDADPPPELAAALQALGIVERQLGKPKEAIAHLTEAVDILESRLEPGLADALEALALSLQDDGRSTEAGARLEEVLGMRREAADPGPLALTLDHLAMNLLVRGEYERVRPLLDEALILLPADAASTRARVTGHLARLHHTLGSHARALGLLENALDIAFEDPPLRLSLRSQAALAKLRLGREEEALADFNRIADDALEIHRNDPIASSPYLNNLGSIALELGKPGEAAEHFAGAVGRIESSLGPEHPSLMTPLNNLGVALIASGDPTRAAPILDRCASLQSRYLPESHLRVAETRRNLATIALLTGAPDRFEKIDEATRIGLGLLDSLVREGSERERLNFLNRFDNVSLVCSSGDAGRIAGVLWSSKGRLMDALLGRSDRFAGTAEPTTLPVPAGSAFIDICRFHPVDSPGGASYGAVIHTPEARPKWVRLGTEDEFRRQLSLLHRRLEWQAATLAGGPAGPPPPMKLAAALKSLHRLFWEPIEAGLPAETRHVAWSPDGILHFLPTAALLDSGLTPLCHRYHQFTTVAHARELLEPPVGPAALDEDWTLLAVSHFPKPDERADRDSPLLELLKSLKDMPGTIDEIGRLSAIAPRGSRTLVDPQATETALRSLSPPPAVLHLGCHAFYLDSEPATNPAGVIDFDERADLLQAGGLVLFDGVRNAFEDGIPADRDDILYPAEIAGLNLSGTRLVTLSSCDSGRGTPVSGEGLLGLRRAFHLAGAREVLVSLWPVSDAAAPAFMERFYQLARLSGRPSQALWQVQAENIPRGDASDFEVAVLRHAPFTISQSGPLVAGDPVTAPEPPPAHGKTPVRLLTGAILGLTLLWFAWTLASRKRRLRDAR